MTAARVIPEDRHPLPEALARCVAAAEAWEIVPRPSTAGSFPARVAAARRALKSLDRDLSLLQAPRRASIGSQNCALLELRASARLLRAAVRGVSDSPAAIARLPRVVLPAQKDEPRIATVAAAYLRAVGGEFSAPAFQEFVGAIQDQDALILEEAWKISAFLQFVLLESLLDEARLLLHSPDSAAGTSTAVHLKSLRAIALTDWARLMEPLILFDAILCQDPAQAYSTMDFDSRELYRRRVAFISRHSDCSEAQVARAALDLCRAHEGEDGGDGRIRQRRIHVGYYLLGSGRPALAERTAFHPPFGEHVRSFMRAHAGYFYITAIEILTILFLAALIVLPLGELTIPQCLLAAAVLAMPAMQCAVDLVNNVITSIFEPDVLPKLDFGKGIPSSCATLAAVPSLLLSEEQVRSLVNDLEVRFLANRDANLHFALLTDLPDSAAKPRTGDAHPLVELAARLIEELNAKYDSARDGRFVFLHRHRIFNVRQGVWMGWERKRGKLLDLNKLLAGEFDAFPIKAGRLDVLGRIRYVLTLDADTQLPRGAAARMAGAIAHPLHRAIVDPRQRIVVDGYGILQPRIGISVRSASRSRLASIFSGQTGFDIYSRAVSDAYQDLYGEGIFTGKGIYEWETLHAVLDRRFPRNALLSHDLIEGAYARAGLASDIELIDDYPSHLSAYNRRRHRWVRGDWQIAQWMFSRVPDESGHKVRNPIAEVNRWKIFDNLRRSLAEPFTLMLFVAGWLGLPGGAFYWTIVALALLIFPALAQCAFGLARALVGRRRWIAFESLAGFSKSAFVALLNLAYLPHQAMVAIDAIVRALVRRFITGERLLEWETAAQAESSEAAQTPVDRYLAYLPAVSIALAIAIHLLNPDRRALMVAAPILLLWAMAPLAAAWLDAPARNSQTGLNRRDEAFLMRNALAIWRYFRDFGGERHNFLVPDNVEESGMFEAERVSPTNVGLLLNARQAACELGLLSVPEFAELTRRSLSTIARMEKFRGHLYNWYDTRTLEPLGERPFVSSVDSGNLAASLYTLSAGARDLLERPVFDWTAFAGLRAHWELVQEQRQPAAAAHPALPAPDGSAEAWLGWIAKAQEALPSASGAVVADDPGKPYCPKEECRDRMIAIEDMALEYTPWLLAEFAPLVAMPQFADLPRADTLTWKAASGFAGQLAGVVAQLAPVLSGSEGMEALANRLLSLLGEAIARLDTLCISLGEIAQQAERYARQTELAFLVDPGRQVLSIGYDVRSEKRHEACYDMLASEARIATFLAIAHDEMHQQSWFKLSREHTEACGSFVLLSWTGTMFEYLMPALWMRCYPDTLISRSLAACVRVQRAFAGSLNIPWGISESGASLKDDLGHYHYQAYGVPSMALSAEADAGPVVSPYSSFLALTVDARAALRNLRRMALAGWSGTYGFYEAADYSAPKGAPILVREWMAHHQGMSLLAILNLLRNNAVQRWFHSHPAVQATELLLHEAPVSKAALRARMRE